MKLGKIELHSEQFEAMRKLKVGNILMGGVGSGKTFTSIFWAHEQLSSVKDKTIYVITTAMKRDLIEDGKDKPDWQSSLELCGISPETYVVDSWNNIGKYEQVKDALFLFDEQRVVGWGKWAKAFIEISKHNKWILLSATPGDTYLEYMPVFIANGFYKNKTEFINTHVEYDPYAKYPRIKKFHEVGRLEEQRRSIIVPMGDHRKTKRHVKQVYVGYDRDLYDTTERLRFNFIEDRPMATAAEYTQMLRRVTYESQERIDEAEHYMRKIPAIIVFYNFNYELDILRDIAARIGKPTAEWNGQKHERIPAGPEWIYLVQYTAGSEGWNCVLTDSILFYSLNHSYKKMEQAMGRIDRSNTKFIDLHYYLLQSQNKTDASIYRTVMVNKKEFNEAAWNPKISRYFKNKQTLVDAGVYNDNPFTRNFGGKTY